MKISILREERAPGVWNHKAAKAISNYSAAQLFQREKYFAINMIIIWWKSVERHVYYNFWTCSLFVFLSFTYRFEHNIHVIRNPNSIFQWKQILQTEKKHLVFNFKFRRRIASPYNNVCDNARFCYKYWNMMYTLGRRERKSWKWWTCWWQNVST